MPDRYSNERSRPNLAEPGAPEYAAEMLSWEFVNSRMGAALNYWIASAGTDGRPHAVPVWGAWLDDVFYFVGAGRKIRNVRADPQAVVHLESGDEVVIIEGHFQEISRPDPDFLQLLDEEFLRKYVNYRPSEHLENSGKSSFPPAGLFSVYPQTVIAWSGFAKDATRWRIPAK
jgi:nitroimidazol reductase NimA-like FMN-containing flavoprotein (pyridoxamine 5'-phosphate oxidase superfamily)